MIGLIDYGMGNLHSVAKALEKVGAKVELVKQADDIAKYDRIVLPGVGAFRDCMATLKDTGMADAIKDTVAQGTPFLGICLGMQVLMTRSYEFGVHAGLNLIEVEVKHFPEDHVARGFKIPHMGWNDIIVKESSLFQGLPKSFYLYFVHSYHVVCDEKFIIVKTHYGYEFASAVQKENIYGFQPHPEKSHDNGLTVLKNFTEL